ncbi:MAG: hypothetical protein L7U45_01190, partial [Alphaproteobacteria bacterium]|nr:hypothetical protein [Alphaproteobacteria bacterium]
FCGGAYRISVARRCAGWRVTRENRRFWKNLPPVQVKSETFSGIFAMISHDQNSHVSAVSLMTIQLFFFSYYY